MVEVVVVVVVGGDAKITAGVCRRRESMNKLVHSFHGFMFDAGSNLLVTVVHSFHGFVFDIESNSLVSIVHSE